MTESGCLHEAWEETVSGKRGRCTDCGVWLGAAPVGLMSATTEFRYAVNDALTELAYRFGAELPDDELNELTHHVADVLDEYRNRDEPQESHDPVQ